MTNTRPTSPQIVQALRNGELFEATVSWSYEGYCDYIVEISSPEFETVSSRAEDAFEALCKVREQLDPLGWLIGVAGAQANVWPSGMARDQGGGLAAYRMDEDRVIGFVYTFEAVDPSTVTTLEAQKAETTRLLHGISNRYTES